MGGDDLQMFKAKAVAVLMGCHTANLDLRLKQEGDGAPFFFLMAGWWVIFLLILQEWLIED